LILANFFVGLFKLSLSLSPQKKNPPHVLLYFSVPFPFFLALKRLRSEGRGRRRKVKRLYSSVLCSPYGRSGAEK
jgi:hypothetical protein